MAERRSRRDATRTPAQDQNAVPVAECLMLANSGEVADGRFYLLGGGVNRTAAAQFPHQQHLAIAFIIRVPEQFAERDHYIALWLVDARGNELMPERIRTDVPPGRRADAHPGEPLRLLGLYGVNFEIPSEGRYEFVLGVDGTEISRVGFRADTAVNT